MKRIVALVASVIAVALCVVPDAEAQWVRTGGLFNSNAFWSFDSSCSHLFADGGSAGLLNSTDLGLSWEQWGADTLGHNVTILLSIGNTLIANYEFGYLRSTDCGITWEGVSVGAWPGSFTTNGKIMFGSSHYDVLPSFNVSISTDSGRTWKGVVDDPRAFPKTNLNGLILCGSTLFAATWNGIFASVDSGQRWTIPQNVLKDSGVFPFQSTQAQNGGMMLLAGLGSEGIFGTHSPTASHVPKLFRSVDSGVTWEKADAGLANRYSEVFAGSGDNIFVGTDSGLFRSTDEGVTWKSAGLDTESIASLFMTSGVLFTRTWGNRTFRSTNNGVSWSLMFAEDTHPNYLATIGDHLFVSTRGSMAFRSSDSGESWNPIDDYLNGQQVYIQYLASSDSELYAGTNGGLMFHSHDYGDAWYGPESAHGGSNVSAFAKIDSTVLIGTFNDRVFLSTNGGSSWKDTGTGLYSSKYDNRVSCLAPLGKTLFAGTTDKGVYRSTDDGKNWMPSGTGIPDTTILALAANASSIFASTRTAGVYRSDDFGASWKAASNGLSPMTQIDCLAITGNNIFAGSHASGVFVSSNAGASWSNANLDVANHDVNDLAISGGNLYAAIDGLGVWRRPLSEMITQAVGRTRLSATIHLRSYPNPLSQNTSITFSSRGGSALVSIINLLGIEVLRVFEGELGAGEHSFTWDANGMPPGTYECVVRSGDSVEHLPVVVIR